MIGQLLREIKLCPSIIDGHMGARPSHILGQAWHGCPRDRVVDSHRHGVGLGSDEAQHAERNMNLAPLDMVIDAITFFNHTIFGEIFITACWIIWTTRNSVIFYNGSIDLNLWMRNFKDELDLVCTKSKAVLISGEIAS